MLSETQLLAIALATAPTILVVASGILLNNHRLNDLRDSMHRELGSTKEMLRAEIRAGDSGILAQMATNQMDLISKIAEIDNRITRLER